MNRNMAFCRACLSCGWMAQHVDTSKNSGRFARLSALRHPYTGIVLRPRTARLQAHSRPSRLRKLAVVTALRTLRVQLAAVPEKAQ